MPEPSYSFDEILERFDIQGPPGFEGTVENGLRTRYDLYSSATKTNSNSLRAILDRIWNEDFIYKVEFIPGVGASAVEFGDGSKSLRIENTEFRLEGVEGIK